jgi:hypothetical protein
MRRLVVAVGALVAISAITAAGCSLGLDPSLIDHGADAAAVGDAAPPSEAGGDGAKGDAEGDGATQIPPGQCATDSDCTTTNACVTSTKCDPSSHVCVFDVCPTGVCMAAVCDGNTMSCSAPVTYGYHAGSFKVGVGGVGCGAASRCFAAEYPYVFVGTTNGVVAYRVDDPTDDGPVPVPVDGLPFLPDQMVATGRRIYFVGSVVGSGPTYHVPVAWVDVPQDPFLPQFNATSVFVGYAQSSWSSLFAATTGSIFLVNGDASQAFPTALLTAPVADSSTLALSSSPDIAAGAGPVAASGSRLVTYRYLDAPSYLAAFSFETGAGTSGAQNLGEQMTTAMGPTTPEGFLAQGTDGSLLWDAPSATIVDGGPNMTATARMTWLLASATATTFAETAFVDVESYTSEALGFGAAVAGPMAWIDTNTVLVTAAAPEDNSQTSVQIASRAMTPPTVVASHRYVVPVDVGHIGAASSNGFGYVLVQDDPMNATATVHVFAPTCQ